MKRRVLRKQQSKGMNCDSKKILNKKSGLIIKRGVHLFFILLLTNYEYCYKIINIVCDIETLYIKCVCDI